MNEKPIQTIGQIGEFGLIDRLSSLLGRSEVVAGIGDDTAVIDQPGPEYLLATVDSLVRDVHFHPEVDPEAIGAHAMAVNISDIAAMGGTPHHALVSLALPLDTSIPFVTKLYEGMQRQAALFDVTIVGGNTATTPGSLMVDVFLLGGVPKEELVLRRGAAPGDILAVTGTLGRTAADRMESRSRRKTWSWHVEPRIATGRALAAAHLPHAMIDLSDGLASDLHNLCRASNVGAVIYETNLPISIQLRGLCRALDLDPRHIALSGGEDYELLMALSEDDLMEVRRLAGEVPISVVGTVLHPDQGIVIEHVGGQRDPLPSSGWKHF